MAPDKKKLNDITYESSVTTDNTASWSNDSTEDSYSLRTETHKDRGYAWVVLVSSFICQVVGVGSALSAGTFTPTLLKTFEGSREAVAWVGSLHTGFVFFAGPIAGVLVDRFGYRVVIISGALLSSSGIALSAFATQLWMLYITYGTMGGVGICLMYIPSVTLLANYFERWKHIAFSVSAAGVGIGTMILPQYIQMLLLEYGWRGAYILTGGVMLQLTLCGALMRDPPHHKTQKEDISLFKELSILCDWRFVLFLVNNYLFNFGSLIVFVFISDYAELQGMSSQQGVYLISILGFSNGIGRILNTVFGVCECNRTYLYVLTCTLSGASVCLIALPTQCPHPCFIISATCCALYGGLFGVQLGNHAILTHNLAGVEKLNTAFGVAMMLNGAGAATGPPFAGYLYKLTGGYEMAYYVGGGTVILAGLVLIPILKAKRADLPSMSDLPANLSVSERVIASIPALQAAVSRENIYVPRSMMDLRTMTSSNHHLSPPLSASYNMLTVPKVRHNTIIC